MFRSKFKCWEQDQNCRAKFRLLALLSSLDTVAKSLVFTAITQVLGPKYKYHSQNSDAGVKLQVLRLKFICSSQNAKIYKCSSPNPNTKAAI